MVDTIPPSDFSYFEWLDEVVQQEPAGSLDPELMGSIAAIGIVKGKPFAPDERMKRILTEAAAVGNATARSLFMHPRDPSWYYYPGSAWMPLTLTISGYDFDDPAARDRGAGARRRAHARRASGPSPPTGYRDARRPHMLLLRRHGHQPGGGDAPERHRLAVPDGRPWTRTSSTSTGPGRTRLTLPGTSPRGTSGP